MILAPMPRTPVALASPARRTAAYLLDGAALVLLSRILLPGWHARVQAELLSLLQTSVSASQTMPGPMELWARGSIQMWLLGSIIALCLSVCWDFAWLATVGATPGQLLCGIRLVLAGHELPGPVPRSVAWRRTVCRRLLTSFVKPLFWLSSAFLVQSDGRQDWPDRWAGTQVVEVS